jgi:hypothetical protein
MGHPFSPLCRMAWKLIEKNNKLLHPVCQERLETTLAIIGKDIYHTKWTFFVTGFLFPCVSYWCSGRRKAMAVIRMDMLAEVYSRYKFASYDEERNAVIDEGLRKIFLRLDRYTTDPAKYLQKSTQAVHELEAILERFYHQDSRFLKLIHSKAQSYIIKKKQKKKNSV